MLWFQIFVLAFVALLIPTAYAGFIGAPYAPTRLSVVRKALRQIGLDKDDVLVDLGAGDGGIVLEAAKLGAQAIGWELSPIMFAVAWLRAKLGTSPYQGEVPAELAGGEVGWRKPVIRYGNFFKQDLSAATVIFLFLMPKNMPHVKDWLSKQKFPRGRYLLSYAFPLPETPPAFTVSLPQKGTIYVYNLKEISQK